MKNKELTTIHNFETDLFDCDGSCRDINFSEYISTVAAIDVLNFIASLWSLKEAINGDREDIEAANFTTFLGQEAGSLSTIWDGGCNPKEIQLYFSWSAHNRIFCELTFFPEDLDREQFTIEGFLLFLSKLVRSAHSDEYYVRFEYASWQHGQPEGNESVILSHESFSLPVS